jgi:hypothetical protein
MYSIIVLQQELIELTEIATKAHGLNLFILCDDTNKKMDNIKEILDLIDRTYNYF